MATVLDADDVISVVMTTTTLNSTEATSSSTSEAVLSCDVPELMATVITLGAGLFRSYADADALNFLTIILKQLNNFLR